MNWATVVNRKPGTRSECSQAQLCSREENYHPICDHWELQRTAQQSALTNHCSPGQHIFKWCGNVVWWEASRTLEKDLESSLFTLRSKVGVGAEAEVAVHAGKGERYRETEKDRKKERITIHQVRNEQPATQVEKSQPQPWATTGEWASWKQPSFPSTSLHRKLCKLQLITQEKDARQGMLAEEEAEGALSENRPHQECVLMRRLRDRARWNSRRLTSNCWHWLRGKTVDSSISEPKYHASGCQLTGCSVGEASVRFKYGTWRIPDSSTPSCL